MSKGVKFFYFFGPQQDSACAIGVIRRDMGVSDAVGGVGYPGVEPQGYISGGRPAACVLCDGGELVSPSAMLFYVPQANPGVKRTGSASLYFFIPDRGT